MMTAHARKIGLESVTFRNATGWPHPEHRISTYDLAQLGQRSVERYPEFYRIYRVLWGRPNAAMIGASLW